MFDKHGLLLPLDKKYRSGFLVAHIFLCLKVFLFFFCKYSVRFIH